MMLIKGNKEGSQKFDTLIGPNCHLEGRLSCNGIVRIDGNVQGNIETNGDIIIGEKAYINGNLSGSNIHISGKVEGDIICTGLLKMTSTSSLYGNIKVKNFVADEGSIFEGKCSVQGDTSAVTSNEAVEQDQ
jgi:cytoskeletal protein CcmA (bactofilin family)